jgi:hypothetical protein
MKRHPASGATGNEKWAQRKTPCAPSGYSMILDTTPAPVAFAVSANAPVSKIMQ